MKDEIPKERTIVDKIEDILTSYGFKFSPDMSGWDNHYYHESEDIFIIFDVKEFILVCYRNKKKLFYLMKEHLTLNSLCKELSDL